jgi:ZIP family zinc transporter
MLLMTGAAGACILLGGLLAGLQRILPRWLDADLRHSVMAFGGGVLVSAVALVLVPEGAAAVGSAWLSVALFLAGGIVFAGLEAWMAGRGGSKPQLIALLLDYVPESLALGGLFVAGSDAAPMLALLIALQNLPEGFNARRELEKESGGKHGRALLLMAAMIPLGPLFGTLGWAHGADHPEMLGGVMLFAAGGILYLIFQEIAPQSRLERHWAPTVGAVIGFSLGLLGDLLIHST